MDNEVRIKRLLNTGFGYLGMINEARMRCKILKERVKSTRLAGIPAEECGAEFQQELDQIQSDLSKYTRRLARLHEELKGYGAFSELE